MPVLSRKNKHIADKYKISNYPGCQVQARPPRPETNTGSGGAMAVIKEGNS
jgi:hypothetical protein